MKFEGANCTIIRDKIKSKEDVVFDIDRKETVFAASQAPSVWQAYPLSILSKEELLNVIGILAMDVSIRASFHRLELLVERLGGTILYKENGLYLISVKVIMN